MRENPRENRIYAEIMLRNSTEKQDCVRLIKVFQLIRTEKKEMCENLSKIFVEITGFIKFSYSWDVISNFCFAMLIDP